MDEFKIGHIITGLIAGSFSLIFNEYPRTRLQRFRAFFVVCGGAIVTAYLTPLVLEWLNFIDKAEYGVAFIIGLFGMGVIEGVYKIVQAFVTNPIKILSDLKKMWRGES